MQLRKMEMRISLFWAKTKCIDFIYFTMGDPAKQNLERYIRKMQVLAGNKKRDKVKGCENAKES